MKHYPVHPIKEGYVAVTAGVVIRHARDGCSLCYNYKEIKSYVSRDAGVQTKLDVLCGKAICPPGHFIVPAELAVQWRFDSADRS